MVFVFKPGLDVLLPNPAKILIPPPTKFSRAVGSAVPNPTFPFSKMAMPFVSLDPLNILNLAFEDVVPYWSKVQSTVLPTKDFLNTI